eukprot:TRINITY_DN2330_c0_g1_i2.p2 TRINITY_DN2330_c0_g1~~TRINITY_DN2330_c0_g1_i2.p2  ORF type:complete len:184 (-),score=16.23 TRINITY_DN2330_c0_g1_i2:407-958(-)
MDVDKVQAQPVRSTLGTGLTIPNPSPSRTTSQRSNSISVHAPSALSRTSSFLAGGNLGPSPNSVGGLHRSTVSPMPVSSNSSNPAGIASPSAAMLGGTSDPAGAAAFSAAEKDVAAVDNKRLFGPGVSGKGRTQSNATVSNLNYMFPGLSALPGQVVGGAQIGATDKTASGARKIFTKPEESR